MDTTSHRDDLAAMTLIELGDLKRTMSSVLFGHRYGTGHTCNDVCTGREESYRVVADAYRAKRDAALAKPSDLSGWMKTEADWEPSYGGDYDGGRQ